MNNLKRRTEGLLVDEGIKYLDMDPVKNLGKMINLGSKIAAEGDNKKVMQAISKAWNTKDGSKRYYMEKILSELHPNVRKKMIKNFVLNAYLYGRPEAKRAEDENDCNIPWAILMDPTTRCNLKCIGCWAAEYNKKDELDFDTLDRIIREGKGIGTYMYIYSGGEPTMRKDDILRLAEIHDDCMFLAFTNGTLIDDSFAKKVQMLGNIAFAISVEGFEKETDMRRGKGTFKKVVKAMETLKRHGILFGFSTCYHSKNTDVVGSDEYIDFVEEHGCLFGWYFTYMPLGKDADTSLLATSSQRAHMYKRVREIRAGKPIFVLDFWNDGEYVSGCIAGGRKYLHINANGDVEPCAFIHYSNVNIKEVSLLDALKSPIFMQYRRQYPFNNNHLRPCPMFDNPEKLVDMVNKSDACSTQPVDHETAEELCAKCDKPASEWGPVAERLWSEKTGGKSKKQA
ncbi:MAG: radical SAM protein [Peptostreptococcaceae bacterium]|nr:radical SAM protein [Peptostreptococcaceae bacterium]